ncbi:MAG TPA: hypothetical protein PKA90_14135 [Ignavibacteria bacterium]|nr:hypothetical protein [Ignavibacteria bacterium]HMR41558.1 hypothetical protein [Ignavibacteria bacterium]
MQRLKSSSDYFEFNSIYNESIQDIVRLKKMDLSAWKKFIKEKNELKKSKEKTSNNFLSDSLKKSLLTNKILMSFLSCESLTELQECWKKNTDIILNEPDPDLFVKFKDEQKEYLTMKDKEMFSESTIERCNNLNEILNSSPEVKNEYYLMNIKKLKYYGKL